MNNNTMEYIETVSTDELRKVQLERIKKTLVHAYQNSPVYRKKFDDAGVHPEDFQHLEDLAKFPLPLNRICVIIIRSACLPCLRKKL